MGPLNQKVINHVTYLIMIVIMILVICNFQTRSVAHCVNVETLTKTKRIVDQRVLWMCGAAGAVLGAEICSPIEPSEDVWLCLWIRL